MTIVTKPLNGEKKDPTKEKELLSPDNPDVSVAMSDDDEPEISYKTMRRAVFVSQACLLLTGIVAIGIGILFGAHVYQQFHGRRHHYRSFCRLPYLRNVLDRHSSKIITGDLKVKTFGDERITVGGHIPGVVKEELSVETKKFGDGSLEFDFELDLDFNEFESFEFPEIFNGRYFHDFKSNKTAIIDLENSRCFVMPMDRSEISPPRNLYDMIVKMKAGEYDLDLEEIRHDMRAVLPPVEELYDYGYFIANACYDKTTYRLEESSRVRRSLNSETPSDWAEYTGKYVIKYNIQNLSEL